MIEIWRREKELYFNIGCFHDSKAIQIEISLSMQIMNRKIWSQFSNIYEKHPCAYNDVHLKDEF